MTKEKDKEVVKALSLKNGYLEKLISFLDCPLHGVEARARNRFVAVIGKQLSYLDTERQRLLKEYSNKNEKGEPKTIENGTRYDIAPENLAKVNEELLKIYNEDFLIDILPSTEVDVRIIKQVILKTPKEFNIEDGAVYDVIAQSFEAIK